MSSVPSPTRDSTQEGNNGTRNSDADDTAAVAAAAAAAAAATANAAPTSHSNNPELDTTHLANLPAEQQELTLLQFAAKLNEHVRKLEADDCTAQQFYLKKEIFKMLQLTTPAPTRVVRNTLGRCLAHVFGKGDRKLLFETIHDLMATISNTGKIKEGSGGSSSNESRIKQAAVVCLGEVYGAAGDSAIGLHQVACGTLLKTLKMAQSSSHAGMRAAVFGALTKVVTCIGTSLDEGVARDVWKQARSHATTDKGGLVCMAACRCLTALIRSTTFFDGTSDFESLQKTVFKTIEASSPHVRHAAVDSLVEAMVKGYAEFVEGGVVTTGGSAASRLKRTRSRAIKKSIDASWSHHRPRTMICQDRDLAVQHQERAVRQLLRTTARATIVLVLPLPDLLKLLSTHYVKLSTSNRARVAIGICYHRVLLRLGEKAVEQHFLAIVENLTVDLLGHSNIANHRYRLLVARRVVDTLVQDVMVRRILSETGQIKIAKALLNDILKDYPQVIKERPEPSQHTLVTALGALSTLIEGLGSAANGFAESCREGLLQLLPHPTYSVQLQAAACLKAFVLACPQHLLPCLTVCMNSVTRELGQVSHGVVDQHRRCLGFAHGLAATLSASPQRPLYGSVDINSRVLTMATNLLKSSGKLELRVASVQIEVAWILIGGLMPLGPNFVKIHLSQMLLLWKNALPKPLARDNVASRNHLETSFLTHVRDCALGSILAFLQCNSRLLTVDVSKRIAAMLQHTTAFLKTLPAKKTTDDVHQRLMLTTPALQLSDLAVHVQRRVLQCYLLLINLAPAGGTETLVQANLLTLALSLFADPDPDPDAAGGSNKSSLSTSIATAAGSFDTIWDVGDNCGFGVTGLVSGFRLRPLPGQHEKNAAEEAQLLTVLDEADGPEGVMESLLLSPVCGAFEHDTAILTSSFSSSSSPSSSITNPSSMTPSPPPTEVVNLAIQLFAFVFPLTPAKVQESVLEQMASFLSAGSLQREPGRKAAIHINVAVALLSTLKVAVRETQAPSAGNVTSPAVETLLQDLLRGFVVDPDPYVRSIGYAAVGRLCNACGNSFTNHEIKHLVDTIVVNREPSARAGCAMALGCIQTKVGGMAAGYHLKTILGILMSLCNDPHPTVHFWALEAFARASDAAGLNFASYVASTLGMLAQLYGAADHHHAEVASAVSMNLELDLSTTAAIARCVDALINVLGPDLQESTKSRELLFRLVRMFQDEDDDDDVQVQRAGLACLEHLSLYAPGYVDFAAYVQRLQQFLGSAHPALRDAAVDGLYNLMKRNANDVVAAAAPGLEDQLWLLLDQHPGHDGVRNILRDWLRQTGLTETTQWLQRCQRVLKMTRPKVAATTHVAAAFHGRGGAGHGGGNRAPAIDLQDEEVAGLGAAVKEKEAETETEGATNEVSTTTTTTTAVATTTTTGDPSTDVEPLRWQISAFVLSLLLELFQIVAKDAASHVNSQTDGTATPALQALQQRVGDVVKMAFSASTAGVVEQRIGGLQLFGALLRLFGKTPDPDFDEAMLLEQYQAQISSALSPAFAADSSPELACEAVRVCAQFVATGIVTDVDRMGRILKTLVTALTNFTSETASSSSIGDLKGLSANARVMVKMAVFAAWAELQVASAAAAAAAVGTQTDQKNNYLSDVLRPHLAQLTPLWLASLREFARLRFEPDISMTLGPPSLSGSLDTIYAALNRETLLAFYQDVWLQLVDAIASLIEQDSGFVFDALDGRETITKTTTTTTTTAKTAKTTTTDINYRDEPVAFFFVLFGIAFEALAARQSHGVDPSVDPSSSTTALAGQGQTLEILLALKKILHPSVSGQAIYREAVFSETMDLLDRLVLTEALDVQGVIVEIARALCLAHPAARTREQPETGELSDDIEQLFELTRIMVLVLSGILPLDLSSSPPSVSVSMTEDAVLVLVRTALDALVDAAEVFPAIIRTDLHACLVHIFATVLATPACQDVVVPQALPILKRFIATAAGPSLSASTSSQTTAQMRGCLRRFLSIYVQAQKREAATSLPCVKNCLLAMTILFTAGHNRLAIADPLVVKFLDELLDCLTDRMTAKIAANCCRSLLLHHVSAADQSIGRYLLPRLIAFVTDTNPEDPTDARGLVAQTLSAFVVADKAAHRDDHVPVAMALVVPALLARAAGEDEHAVGKDGAAAAAATTTVDRETSGRLLELASADPPAFRAVVAGLNEQQRALMEGVIKAGQQAAASQQRPTAESGQPTIALKMNFGE